MTANNTLRHALALATCALVNGTAHAEEGDWRVAGSFLHYSEVDRITALEPALFATQDLGNEETLGVRLVYDSLTGASPSGASVTNTAQTIGTTTIAANTLPTEKFSDTRTAIGIDYGVPTSRVSAGTLSFNYSKENDYQSVGASGTLTRDYNNKLTTLTLALGGSYDTLQPAGTIPTGLQSITAVQTTSAGQTMTGVSGGTTTNGGGTTSNGSVSGSSTGCKNCEYKSTGDVMVGVSQVLSRRTLMQMNYSVNFLSGYLTDPYKVVSVVDATTGSTVDYVFEKRPKKRIANSIFMKLVHNFDEDVVHMSYRYFLDDWNVRAHTAELHYRFRVTDWLYFEPQYRYYQQTKAKFFHHSVANDVSLTGDYYVSADLRLADMISRSAGVKLGITTRSGTEFSARVVRMTQEGDSHPSDAIGVQKLVDMNPKMEATIANISFSVPF